MGTMRLQDRLWEYREVSGPLDPDERAAIEADGWHEFWSAEVDGIPEHYFRRPASRARGFSPWLAGRRPGRRR